MTSPGGPGKPLGAVRGRAEAERRGGSGPGARRRPRRAARAGSRGSSCEEIVGTSAAMPAERRRAPERRGRIPVVPGAPGPDDRANSDVGSARRRSRKSGRFIEPGRKSAEASGACLAGSVGTSRARAAVGRRPRAASPSKPSHPARSIAASTRTITSLGKTGASTPSSARRSGTTAHDPERLGCFLGARPSPPKNGEQAKKTRGGAEPGRAAARPAKEATGQAGPSPAFRDRRSNGRTTPRRATRRLSSPARIGVFDLHCWKRRGDALVRVRGGVGEIPATARMAPASVRSRRGLPA